MTAEAINRKLPASYDRSGLRDRLAEIYQSVAEKHRGAEWPPIATFSEASTTKVVDVPVLTMERDPFERFVRRVNAGEAVAEFELLGSFGEKALRENRFTRDQILPYQRMIYVKRRCLHGTEAADQWRRENCPSLPVADLQGDTKGLSRMAWGKSV